MSRLKKEIIEDPEKLRSRKRMKKEMKRSLLNSV
jgi:hypothetical protein